MSNYRVPGAAAAVALLLVAYAVSFLDRQILSLLVRDLRADLAISDTQIGLLQGPAFGIFYAIMGLPFGWLADRVHRVRLVGSGILLWSLMTIAGGCTHEFVILFVTRMGVGVGEAALVPAAVSLIADSFPPERRALPLALFTAGVSVGTGLSLALGGLLIRFAGDHAAWFPGWAVWQVVLVSAGSLGLPLALAMLMIREPGRGPQAEAGGTLPLYIGRHHRLFLLMLAGSTALYIPSYATSAWMPSLFVRRFGWEPADVGVRLGVTILFAALLGNIASGTIATALTRRGRAHGTLLTMAGGAALLAPCAIMAPLAPSAGLAQIGFTAIYTAIALCFGVATASFVAVTPAPLRGRMSALYLSAGNLAGMMIGPPLTGYLLQHVLAAPDRVGQALALVAIPSGVGGAICLWLAVPHHARRSAELVGG